MASADMSASRQFHAGLDEDGMTDYYYSSQPAVKIHIFVKRTPNSSSFLSKASFSFHLPIMGLQCHLTKFNPLAKTANPNLSQAII
jgi:hypothetical protein